MASKKRILKRARFGTLSLPEGHPFIPLVSPPAAEVVSEEPKVTVSQPAEKKSKPRLKLRPKPKRTKKTAKK